MADCDAANISSTLTLDYFLIMTLDLQPQIPLNDPIMVHLSATFLKNETLQTNFVFAGKICLVDHNHLIFSRCLHRVIHLHEIFFLIIAHYNFRSFFLFIFSGYLLGWVIENFFPTFFVYQLLRIKQKIPLYLYSIIQGVKAELSKLCSSTIVLLLD